MPSRITRTIRSAAFALCCLRLTAADVSRNVTGHWKFEGDVGGNPIRLQCDLTQAANKMEGVCKAGELTINIAGEVNDPKVRFSYSVAYQGSTYTLYYSGTLEEDSLGVSGEIQVNGTTGTFTGRRDAPAK